MSKKRNRNVRHIFESASINNITKQEMITADSRGMICFGDPVPSLLCQESRGFLGKKIWEQISDFHCCTEDYDFENVDSVSVDNKSSSSSLSWGEECEVESTRQVQREYNRMNRVLQGTEDIPPNYNKDEYKLWIRTFPCLRSTDTRSRARNRIPFSEELTAQQTHCDKFEILPSDVINDVFGEPITNSLSSRKGRKRLYQNRSRNRKEENLERDFENFLRISPAPMSMKPSRASGRHNNEHSPEFVSLPYLSVVQHDVSRDISAKTNISTNNRRKEFAIFELKPTNNNLVLPPINNSQFRSASAVHLQPSVRSSAMSIKPNMKTKTTNKIASLNSNNLLKRRAENKSINKYCCN